MDYANLGEGNLLERSDDFKQVKANDLSNVDKLDDVEPALAVFILGNKGLRPTKASRDIHLRQTSLGPRCLEELEKTLLV